MPRIGEELRKQRRRHVLTSAWSCFSRNGFHATSMDEVISATGMSSSAVYRYFRSKDELIDATVDEAFARTETLFTELLTAKPTPTPTQTIERLTKIVRERPQEGTYDLSLLAMQAWTEALRRPHLRERTGAYYSNARRLFESLAQRWRDEGHIRADADLTSIATLLTTLMPGMIVSHYLVDTVDATRLITGIVDLASME